MIGTVNRLVADRGFGFVDAEDGRRYFAHRSDMAEGTSFDDLHEGVEVTFAPADPAPPKGPRATGVALVEAAANGPAEAA